MPELGEDAFNRDRAGSVVELGPRSLALLRRLVFLLETAYELPTPDPGKTFEDEAAQFGSPTNIGG
jgi:hypothetical protein